jgi:hypothetical protein
MSTGKNSEHTTPSLDAISPDSVPGSDLSEMAIALDRSGQYRVLCKYQRPSRYSTHSDESLRVFRRLGFLSPATLIGLIDVV